jgi:hypothetical protein
MLTFPKSPSFRISWRCFRFLLICILARNGGNTRLPVFLSRQNPRLLIVTGSACSPRDPKSTDRNHRARLRASLVLIYTSLVTEKCYILSAWNTDWFSQITKFYKFANLQIWRANPSSQHMLNYEGRSSTWSNRRLVIYKGALCCHHTTHVWSRSTEIYFAL